MAQRNLAPAGIVLAPALGLALTRRESAGEEAAGDPAPAPEGEAEAEPVAPTAGPGRRDRLVAVLVGVVAVVLVGNALSSGALALESYPVEVVQTGERIGAFGPDRVVATQDTVGCYLILRRGRGARVFIDDRYDMYPQKVSLDYVSLLRAGPGAVEVLDQRDVDAVLWDRSLPLVPALQQRGWREAAGDMRWVLLERP